MTLGDGWTLTSELRVISSVPDMNSWTIQQKWIKGEEERWVGIPVVYLSREEFDKQITLEKMLNER